MRVLVDTSVWSRSLRAGSGAVDPVLARLAGKADLVLTGLIVQEVLQGFRGDGVFRKAVKALAAFSLLQLDRAHYVAATNIHRTCASRGTAASTADCQIAAACIEHRCHLLTFDGDFAHIARHVPLKLLSAAPTSTK